MGLLSRREHSRRELALKLCARGHERAVVETVIEQLCQEHLVSDTRFTESFIHRRVAMGYGPVRIRQELRARGIPDGLISRWLDARCGEWCARVVQIRRKRFGQPLPTTDVERMRQARFLQYRGFAAEHIRHAFCADR